MSDGVRTPEVEAAFSALATAVGAYLTSIGWSALVVGNPRVQQQPLARPMNFEFVVQFTGGKRTS